MKHKYLPTPSIGEGESDEEIADCQPQGIYPCPCCGYITLPVPQEEAIAYICPICYWENDVFISSDTEPSDENGGITLAQAKENYKKFSACRRNMVKYVRPPRLCEIPKAPHNSDAYQNNNVNK